MKKLAVSLMVLMVLALPIVVFVGSVGAIDPAPACSNPELAKTNACISVNGAVNSPNVFVKAITFIINILSYIVGIAALIGIIVSSLRMVLSNGDSAGIAHARQGLIYSLVGVVIVAFAQGIVAFVLNRL